MQINLSIHLALLSLANFGSYSRSQKLREESMLDMHLLHTINFRVFVLYVSMCCVQCLYIILTREYILVINSSNPIHS